jgi:hypothetical protein
VLALALALRAAQRHLQVARLEEAGVDALALEHARELVDRVEHLALEPAVAARAAPLVAARRAGEEAGHPAPVAS